MDNIYVPFTEDDLTDQAHMEASMIQCGHQHMDTIAAAIERGTWAHTKIHMMGMEESPTHEMLVQDIATANALFRRGLNAIWC